MKLISVIAMLALSLLLLIACAQQNVTQPDDDLRFEVQPRPGNELVFTQIAPARPPFESRYESITMTLRGNGSYLLNKTGPENKSRVAGNLPGRADEMRRVMQSLVDAGLYDLRSIHRRLGTRGHVTVPVGTQNESPEQLVPGYGFHATINGRSLEVAYPVRNLPPHPPEPAQAVVQQLNELRDRIDPPQE